VLNELFVVTDGEEAMRFLRQEAEYVDAPRPDLVLLDLNLPRMDGREVLQEMKGDDQLNTIPVVVMTTSAADEDVLAAYHLQAASYVTKPVGFVKFMRAVQEIEQFWLSVVRLPPD
jgi:CheY-like chemotaxis protein